MEQSLFHAINQQWTSPALDLFMAGLSDSQIWTPFLIAIGIGALISGGFKARALVICLGMSLAEGWGSAKTDKTANVMEMTNVE